MNNWSRSWNRLVDGNVKGRSRFAKNCKSTERILNWLVVHHRTEPCKWGSVHPICWEEASFCRDTVREEIPLSRRFIEIDNRVRGFFGPKIHSPSFNHIHKWPTRSLKEIRKHLLILSDEPNQNITCTKCDNFKESYPVPRHKNIYVVNNLIIWFQ